MKHERTHRGRSILPAAPCLCAYIAAAFGATLLAAPAGAQEAVEDTAGQIDEAADQIDDAAGQMDDTAAQIENTEEITATVTAIEPQTRMLTLRSEDGEETTVQAGDKVRNFEQIEVGDQVDVLFYEALVAEVTDAPPTAQAGGEPVVIDSRRAALGEKPGGAVSTVYTAVVTIDAVDPEENTVAFTGPGGQPREVVVERPEMQAFIKSLEPGDRVQVTYGEALAVAVRPSETEEAE